MMATISDKDRAEAQAMFDTLRGGHDTTALNDRSVRRWLAVRDHVLAALNDGNTCPDVESDSRVQAWNAIASCTAAADGGVTSRNAEPNSSKRATWIERPTRCS